MLHSLFVIPDYLGRQIGQASIYLVNLATFAVTALVRDHDRGLFNRATFNATVTQVIFTGVDALPLISLLAVATGISVAASLVTVVEVFRDPGDVIDVLIKVIVLELGALMTAIVIIGRSGSAIAVDLGNARLGGEIEGLELLGIDIDRFIVIPRLLGAGIAQVVLSVYFSLLALVSGILMPALFKAPAYFSYFAEIPKAFDPAQIILFLVKNLLFGFVISTAACFHGLQVSRSVTEVPQQTQKAIVVSLAMIFLIDGLIAIGIS